MYWNSSLDASPDWSKAVQPIHVMYWNMTSTIRRAHGDTVQPIHVMYWNRYLKILYFSHFSRSTDTCDVLKSLKPLYNSISFAWFNRYMWCIEIIFFLSLDCQCACSTDTCDVLKCVTENILDICSKFNRYMWCIEIVWKNSWRAWDD